MAAHPPCGGGQSHRTVYGTTQRGDAPKHVDEFPQSPRGLLDG